MAPKSRTLTVKIVATLEVDYDPSDLEAMGKTFREFKSGIENVVKADLLPTFEADKHSRIALGTLSFPTTKKLKTRRNS